MKIDELNTSNLDKYLTGYPENVKTAIKKAYLCLNYDCCTHTVKYYKIGYFFAEEGLQREIITKINPVFEIWKKYYPNIGEDTHMTFGVHEMSGRLFPAYFDYKTGEYHSFTEEMMRNEEMWDEMAAVKISEPSVEYAEELDLNIQYQEWTQKRIIEEQKKANEANRLSLNKKSKWKRIMEILAE